MTDTAPNRILGHELIVVSDDPLIAVLTLDTDDGTFEFAINTAAAEGLMVSLGEVLGIIGPGEKG